MNFTKSILEPESKSMINRLQIIGFLFEESSFGKYNKRFDSVG